MTRSRGSGHSIDSRNFPTLDFLLFKVLRATGQNIIKPQGNSFYTTSGSFGSHFHEKYTKNTSNLSFFSENKHKNTKFPFKFMKFDDISPKNARKNAQIASKLRKKEVFVSDICFETVLKHKNTKNHENS